MTRPRLTLVPKAKPPGRYPNPPAGNRHSVQVTAEAARSATAVRAWHDHNLPWWMRRAFGMEK